MGHGVIRLTMTSKTVLILVKYLLSVYQGSVPQYNITDPCIVYHDIMIHEMLLNYALYDVG